MRLEKIVASVIDQHKREVKPVKTQVVMPIQLVLFDRRATGSEKAIAMGTFYEHMTAAIFGGRLENMKRVANGNHLGLTTNGAEAIDEDDEMRITKPDVVDHKRRRVYESKACRSGQTCKLSDDQIDLYRALQAEEPHPRIYYVVYRHSLDGIKSRWKGTPEQLFYALVQKTSYCLVMPLSLILALHNPKKGSTKYVYRYEEETRFEVCTSIRSSALTALLTEPERVIVDLSFDPNEYKTKRLLSPSELKINSYEVKRYPILVIQDRDHRAWAEGFAAGYRKTDTPF